MTTKRYDRTYPFDAPRIDEYRLREWLTQVIYPSEYEAGGTQRTQAKKRIVSRIFYYRRAGILSEPRHGQVVAQEFFEWAFDQKGWHALLKVEGLPKHATISIQSPRGIGVALGKGSGLALPNDKDHLRGILIGSHVRIQELEDENNQLNRKLQRQRDQARVASEYGRKARGILKAD